MSSPLTTTELARWAPALATLADAADDAERIDRIRLLEQLKSAAAAAQARETVAFKASQLEVQQAAGVPTRDLGRGIGAQVALARRESPHRGGRLVGLAEALQEMPHTFAALERGDVNEWRATILVRETACLSREDRATVDAELADRLPTLGDRQTEAEARRIAYRLDPHAFTARSRKAAKERRVTLRPAPDTMSMLTGLLPAAQGVAAYASLTAQADALRASGDARSRGQLMADILVERLTGRGRSVPTWQETAATITWDSAQQPTTPPRPPRPPEEVAPVVTVELQVLMTDQTLFGYGPGADEPALLAGYGPVPAPLARMLASGNLDLGGVGTDGVAVGLRRLYAEVGALVGMESSRRTFTGVLRRFVTTRDMVCRTPWCNAPIRHIDHPVPVELGGPTSEANGQGLCEACNYTKQAPGWQDQPEPEGAGSSVHTITPTGHVYTSLPPPLPGAEHPPSQERRRVTPSALERHFGALVLAA
jgi:hypothetical protein